jgi:hypothetical protein
MTGFLEKIWSGRGDLTPDTNLDKGRRRKIGWLLTEPPVRLPNNTSPRWPDKLGQSGDRLFN